MQKLFQQSAYNQGTLSSGHTETEPGSSNNSQGSNDATSWFKTKTTKKDSSSAFDLRDIEDLCPYSNQFTKKVTGCKSHSKFDQKYNCIVSSRSNQNSKSFIL